MTCQKEAVLDAALSYIGRGWSLVPLDGKKPIEKDWTNLPPTTEAQAIEYAKRGNFGIRTGKISGIIVVDIDTDHNGIENAKAFNFPRTPTVRTGSGGYHLYFKYPEGGLRNSRSKLAPGIDIRCDGGQVVASPSIHPRTGKPYTWVIPPDECPLAELPSDILNKLKEKKTSFNGKSHNGNMPPLMDRIKRASAYLAKIPGAESGEGGHDKTWKAALAIVKGFSLSVDVAFDLLWREYNPRCNPPWSEKELLHKVTQAAESTLEDGYLLKDATYSQKMNGNAQSDLEDSPHSDSSQSPWGIPEDLPDKLLPVPKMSPLMVPAPFRAWISDISERMQCHQEFPAIGAMVALSALVGRKVGIKPKRLDDWLVVPNLWGAVVGTPGEMKSHTLEEAMKPITRLEIKAREEHKENEQDYEFRCMAEDAEKDKIKTEIKLAVKNGDNLDGIMKRFKGQEKSNLPTPKRYIVNDPSVEKLGELLKENPDGLLLFRDEMTGWLKTLDKDGHENDRSFYLESWNGTGSYTYDRIGRGTVYINAACVSVLGGIQPGPLSAYILKTMKGGAGDDGLMQRIQLFVYPDPPKTWKNIDRFPDVEAKNRAFKIFEKLDNLKIGGANDEC